MLFIPKLLIIATNPLSFGLVSALVCSEILPNPGISLVLKPLCDSQAIVCELWKTRSHGFADMQLILKDSVL